MQPQHNSWQSFGRNDIRIQHRGRHTQQCTDKPHRRDDRRTQEISATSRLFVLGRKTDLDDRLSGMSRSDHHNEPSDNQSHTHTAEVKTWVIGRQLRHQLPHAAELANRQHGTEANTDIDHHHIDHIGQSCRPETADQGDAHEHDRGHGHAGAEVENFREQRRENGAAGHVLQRRDHNLDHQLTEHTEHPSAHAVVTLKQFRQCGDFPTTITSGGKQSHDRGTGGPGGVVPTGRYSRCVSPLGHTDG